MHRAKQLGQWFGRQGARLLISRSGTPVLLVGTLALAGWGALSGPPAAGHPVLQLTSPHTFCHQDWDQGEGQDGDGQVICHILASQVNTFPNLGCHADFDGDGTYVCFYATQPPTNPPTTP
jgi:hypothetical protein